MTDSLSSEEECETLLRKALDVDFPENFNPNSVPHNGEEYLHHVIYERNKCKKLVTSDIDPNKFKNNRTYQVNLINHTKNSPGRSLPSADWLNNKMEDFKYFRNFVECRILQEPTQTTFHEESFLAKVKNQEPLFSYLKEYPQSVKIRMLEIIICHLETLKAGEGIDDNVGMWIFAILVMLEIPLSPTFCYVIREFIRKCLEIRSNLPDDADEKIYMPLNFYICVSSRYFSQLDLAD